MPAPPPLSAYGPCVDEPLMMKAGGGTYYYATYRRYGVAALTASTGAVVERNKHHAGGSRPTILPMCARFAQSGCHQ